MESLPDHSTFKPHFENFLLVSNVILQTRILLDND